MNTRYGLSPLARAIAGASLALGIMGSAGSAAAVTCTFAFPSSTAKTCQQGNSKAQTTHFLGGNPVKFQLRVDFQGGTQLAVAYGIDVNGNQLNQCATTAADRNPITVQTTSVSCASLYGTAGTAPAFRSYNHPQNMASTFVIVL